MKLFQMSSDGGKKSGVNGFFICEFKNLFSVVLLKFNKGSRENYHSHAFNAFTWFLKGLMTEHKLDGSTFTYSRSLRPKYTPRTNVHKVYANKTSWALSIRGPWSETWYEFDPTTSEYILLSNGRKEISRSTKNDLSKGGVCG